MVRRVEPGLPIDTYELPRFFYINHKKEGSSYTHTKNDRIMTAQDLDNVVVMTQINPDQLPHVILRGQAADVSALREVESQAIYLGQRGSLLPAGAITCRVSWHNDDTDDRMNGETTTTTNTTTTATQESCVGDIFVTSSQVLFVAAAATGGGALEPQENDFAIGATCIHLHAMAEEPEISVYLQLTEENDEETTSEVTLVPTDSTSCQVLFDALCKLVSSHPLELDDDDDDQGNDEGGAPAFGGGFAISDDLIWAPSVNGLGDGQDDQEERTAMLARLDNMLVVPPEFEIQEGQFDDADEDSQ